MNEKDNKLKVMKTIAQQLNIKDFPFTIKNFMGYEIYHENSDGEWYKREYDTNGNIIYFENSFGEWFKKEFNEEGFEIYFENSGGLIQNNMGVSFIKKI